MAIGLARFVVNRTRVILFVAVVIGALYLLAVSPVRTYISQRHQMSAEATRYDTLSNANKAMTSRINSLQSDAEIERLAREQYELVPPGQVAFAVMPPADATKAAAAPAPVKHKVSFVSHVWDDVTFWN